MVLTPQLRSLYEKLLNTHVLMEDIHELLKKYKDDNKEIIRLSGSKGDLIENILDAVSHSIVHITEVQALIKDAEEYGDQHIFLYSLINPNILGHLNNGKNLANKIIPAGILQTFPRIMDQPQQLEWGDFRYPNRGITNSWNMKLYDAKFREVKQNDNFDSNTYIRTVTYKREETRLIYVLEWNGQGELEFKISRSTFDSRKGLQGSVGQIMRAIDAGGQGVVLHNNFEKTDLTTCIKNFFLNSSTNQNVFKLLSATFKDSHGGVAIFKSENDQGDDDLLSEESRKEALEAYINDGDSRGTGLVIRFLAEGSGGILKNDINVAIGRDEINHITISAKIKPQEYKYVRRKIEEFN